MPTPQAYSDLLKQHEYLKWVAFQVANGLSREGTHSVSEELYDELWNIVGDCDGKPEWLAKLET